jgi:hypothetical protein
MSEEPAQITEDAVIFSSEAQFAQSSHVLVALEQAGINVSTLQPSTREVLEGLSIEEAMTLARISQRLHEADAELMVNSGGINH